MRLIFRSKIVLFFAALAAALAASTFAAAGASASGSGSVSVECSGPCRSQGSPVDHKGAFESHA